MNLKKYLACGLFFLFMASSNAQYVTDPLPYAMIANPLPDTMDQKNRDSVNLKFSPIRINQAGYRPQDKKFFYYVGSSASTFTVIDESGKTVGSGTLTKTSSTCSGQLKIKASNNAQLVSGGDTRYTMLSSVFSGTIFEGQIPEDIGPGVYRVVVGSDKSAKFVIDERVYSWVRDALLKFYGANRCGDTKSWFHAGCHLKDSVTGGWHDCGDHLKEAATLSYTAAVLGLAAAVFFDRDVDVYSANQGITQVTDGIPDVLYEAKVGADFVLQSYDKAKGDVGKMITSMGAFGNPPYGDDHSWWGRPENQDKMPMNRGGPPRCARSEPTSDYLGKYAANLAFVSKRYQPYDAAYATRCLTAAKAIYDFTKPKLNSTSTPAYSGATIVTDDVAFGALALLWATGERKYLDDLCFDKTIGTKAKSEAEGPKLFHGGLFTNNDPLFTKTTANTDWASCQTHVLWGFFRLILNDKPLCEKLGLTEPDRLGLIEKTMTNLMANLSSVGAGSQTITLPEGVLWVPSKFQYDLPWFTMFTQMEWVWNRYESGNITDLFYYYDIATRIQGIELPHTPASTNWKAAELQPIMVRMADYMLGVNPWDISMIYGVGAKNFNHPHHRAANPEGKNVPGAFYKYCPPVGALQGGYKPVASGANLYDEFYNDYFHSETGIDGTTNILMPVLGLAKQDTIGSPEGTVRIVYVGCDKAIIEVRMSRYGNATLQYGKGTSTDKSVKSDSTGVFHRYTLTGLSEGTLYSFNVVISDVYGRESTLKNINDEHQDVDFTFTTLQNCLTNADIQNVKVCKVTGDSAEIFWYTPNGEFDSKVTYGEQIPPTKVQDGDVSGHPTKFHYVKIGGLKEKTKYYFFVESGASRNDNNGQFYTFTTTVDHVKFDVRTVRYDWSNKPALGVNVVNQDSKAYDSLEMRLYFRDKEGFENDLGARIDIMVLYREDGFQDSITGDLRRAIWANLATQKPTKMPDTYDEATGTYAYYFTIPFWGVQMRSQSRLRFDVVFVRWEPERHQDLLDEAPAHKITNSDWSFGPHSKANGDPIDFPNGVPNLPKEEVDASYFLQPINYYVTIYRKGEYVWGYSPSKSELLTKKTFFELSTQITSPINNPNADYYLYEGSGKTISVKGTAKVTPAEGMINDIWVNGFRQQNPSSLVTWNATAQNYDFNIPVPVKNGRNPVDITIFAGPSSECTECFGCAVTNHSFFLEAPFIQQYPSQLAIKDANLNPMSDTVKIDTTKFHVVVTDKNGNRNKKGKDTLTATIKNLNTGSTQVVTLIETADSSNVFQTVTPIAVVSTPPPQGSTDKILMSGAEQLLVMYVDPTDETDTSRAMLYSKADFPIPLNGWIYDSNGDGSIDKLVAKYNQNIKDLPDSIQFAFPNNNTLRVLKNGTDQFTVVDNNKVSVVFKTPIEKVTGYSSGQSGTGKAYTLYNKQLKSTLFSIKDSAGPVLINNAILCEREEAGDDTLTVTFSEIVSTSKLSGNVLLLRKSGSDTPLDVIAITAMSTETNTVTLLLKSSRTIADGDSVLINPEGDLDDLSGNKAHKNNKPVVVIVKAAPPQIVNASYYDTNADGKIDLAVVELSKSVTPSDCEFTFTWKTDNNKKTISGSQALVDANNSKILRINIENLVADPDVIATSGMMSVKVKHSKLGETQYQSVNDSAAPVIVSGFFQKSLLINSDTLKVEFSESVQPVSDDAFLLYCVKEGKQYTFTCKDIGGTGANRTFIVRAINGVVNPAKGDSIWINTDVTVKELSGNAQSNNRNRRALLRIGKLPLETKLLCGPNPFIPNVSDIINQDDLPEQIKGKKGYLIKLSLGSGAAGSTMLPEIKSSTVYIIDGMGNVIYQSAMVHGSSSDNNNYYLYWNGCNKRNRIVGTGTYIAKIVTETKDDGEGSTRKVDKVMIGVNRKPE